MHLLFAPVLAVVTAVTVHTQVDVPIQHVYVPIVVIGTGGFELSQGELIGSNVQDVTDAEIAAVKARLDASGFAESAIREWVQTTPMTSTRFNPRSSARVGILTVDLGSSAEAVVRAKSLPAAGLPALRYGWNAFVSVDCAAMKSQLEANLRREANETVQTIGKERGVKATLRSITQSSTDPRNNAFEPVPLCSSSETPLVTSTGLRPPVYAKAEFTHYVSASAEIAYTPALSTVSAPASAISIFPYSTFGFAVPIIGQQNQAYTLRGRFAAVPGASEVEVPADAALIEFTFRDRDKYSATLKMLRDSGISSLDYQGDESGLELDVRLRPSTMDLWPKLAPFGEGNEKIFHFLADCTDARAYAHDVAVERSRGLAKAAADVLHVSLGPLVVQTDWAGASSDALCGNDGSADMNALVADANRFNRWGMSDPAIANFWDSIYAAWSLGTTSPRIVSHAIADRLDPVVLSDRPGVEIQGTATIEPDAYFYTGTTMDFTTTIVASKDDVPAGRAPGNVVTNCDAAQQRALANAIKVAMYDGPVNAFYAQPARFLSIACFSSALIGHTYSSFPTVYNNASPTGDAQVTTAITVYR